MPSSVRIYKLLSEHAGVINHLAVEVANETKSKADAVKEAIQKSQDLITELKKD